jgi:hypothetical protein
MTHTSTSGPILVWSSRWYRGTILTYSDESRDEFCNSLIDKLFRKRSSRVEIRNGRYFYKVSEDYKKYVVRFKRFY